MAGKEKRENYFSYDRTCKWCGKDYYTTQYSKKFCCRSCEKAYEREERIRKKRMMSIGTVSREAKALGISYGQYVSKYGV